MSQALADGSLVDGVIAITVLEALALLVYRALTGKGVAASQFLVNLLSGLGLMGALRLVLAGAWWGWVAACLPAARGRAARGQPVAALGALTRARAGGGYFSGIGVARSTATAVTLFCGEPSITRSE